MLYAVHLDHQSSDIHHQSSLVAAHIAHSSRHRWSFFITLQHGLKPDTRAKPHFLLLVSSGRAQVIHNVLPEGFGSLLELCLVAVHVRPHPDQIDLLSGHHLGTIAYLPTQERDQRHHQHAIIRDESDGIPWPERSVADEQDHEHFHYQADPRPIWLEPPTIREGLSIQALSPTSLVKANICSGHDFTAD